MSFGLYFYIPFISYTLGTRFKNLLRFRLNIYLPEIFISDAVQLILYHIRSLTVFGFDVKFYYRVKVATAKKTSSS